MGFFANLVAKLNLDTTQFHTKLKAAMKAVNNANANELVDKMMGVSKKSAFKDPSRIVQGIIVSKIFYGILQSVRGAADAVWEFSQQLEYAKMVYTNLFDSEELAEEFINVLKDFSAVTPFTFEQSEAAAKRLLAYGIQYKNVMYVMQGVLAASTAQNNPAIVESVSRALGQIYTKGRLMNEEMRQLAEAGIPAYEILKDKLGLTQEQLQNLGKNSIPAATAINALVDGMQERFGSVISQSSQTLQGLISNLKDNALMLLSGVFSPVTDKIKEKLRSIGAVVNELRMAYETGGIGAVFEKIVPPSLQTTLRLFITNLRNLWVSIQPLLTALKRLHATIGVTLLQALTAIMPVVNAVINVLAHFAEWITSNEKLLRLLTSLTLAGAAAWAVYKAKALGAMVLQVLAKVISGLANAMHALASAMLNHPIITIISLLIGVAVAVIGYINGMDNALGDLIKKLTGLTGFNMDNLLLPSQKDRTADLSKFNEKLGDTADAMDDLADSTGKATNAAKGLLSFDEVFKLPETKDEETTIDPTVNYDIPDFSDYAVDLDSLMPDTSNFAQFATDFVNNIGKWIKEKIIDQNLGGLVGGALGGALLGGLIGGLPGALIGAAIGGLIGWLVELIVDNWDAIVDWFKGVGEWFAGVFSAIGEWFGGIFSAIGEFFSNVWSAISGFFGGIFSAIGEFFSNIWEGIAGFFGPIFSSIGEFFSGVWEAISGFFSEVWGFIERFSQIFVIIGQAIADLAGIVWDGIVSLGQIIGQAFTDLFTMLGQAFSDLWEIISNFFGPIFEAIGEFFAGIWEAVSSFFSSVWGAVSGFFIDAWAKVSEFFTNAWNTVSSFVSSAWTSITGFFSNIFSAVGEFFTNVFTAIGEFFANLFTTIGDWFAGVWESFTAWLSDIWDKVTSWFTEIFTPIGEFFSGVWQSITSFFTNIWNKVTNFFSNIWTKISGFFSNIWSSISQFFSNIFSAIGNWFSNIFSSIGNFFSNIWSTVTSWGYEKATSIGEWFTNVFKGIAGWFTNLLSSIGRWFSNIWDSVIGWLSNLWDNVVNWWNNLWGIGGGQEVSVTYTRNTTAGHAAGGVFNREHVARFAEGNKAEAIIPLEEKSAMQPFVDAVADGLSATIMPMLATTGGRSNSEDSLRPLYVGTLIADERSLRELNKKMRIIEMSENSRRGL